MSIWLIVKNAENLLLHQKRKSESASVAQNAQTVNKIPGIAMQPQATKEQIEKCKQRLTDTGNLFGY